MLRSLMAAGVTVLLFLSSAAPVTADDNVKAEQDSLKAKHDKVIFLKEIGNTDYALIAAGIATGGASVVAELEEFATSIAQGSGYTLTTETIADLISGKKENTVIGGKPVYVGVVTYSHWMYEKVPGFNKGKLVWKKVKIDLPNTHQLYVAVGKVDKK